MSAPAAEAGRFPAVAGGPRAGWAWIDRAWDGAGATSDELGRPGLWRVVRSGSALARRFDCPALLGRENEAGDDPGLDALADGELRPEGEGLLVPDPGERARRMTEALRSWAAASADAALPVGWRAPDRAEAESWIDPGRLTVRAGAQVARGAFECSEDRLRLRFPELVAFDAALPAHRRAWLEALCVDAQSRWQLVRCGVEAERLVAEVDLSGAPIELAPALVARALEALVFTVGWMLPACVLLADPAVTCGLFDRDPEEIGAGRAHAAR